MSTAYQGNYSYSISDLETNARKRYLMAIQKGKPILDDEISEIAFRGLDFFRSYLMANIGDAALGETDWQVQESGVTNVNNFVVKGGSTNDPAILAVKGYPLILFGDVEYNQQDATGSLTDDDYTKTIIPALSTPGAPRTDEVYVDTYLAESSSEVGSEYLDTTLKDATLGLQTANRFRIVQDIRVAEGTTTPSDGVDGNGIYHRYHKIATLNRIASANITSAMIVDDRVVVNSNKSYQNGTALTIKLKDGEAIGDATHRLSAIYMASKIDYDAEDLAFHKDGAEKMRLTTAGRLGIGTTNPTQEFHLFGNSPSAHIQSTSTSGDPVLILTNADRSWGVQCRGSDFDNFVIRDNTAGSIRLRIDSLGRVGIGTIPAGSTLEVGGSAKIYNNLTVEGTTTTVNTETTVTDKMQIDQDDNQTALEVNKTGTGTGEALDINNAGLSATINAIQTNVSNSSGVIQIDNSGTGPAIRISGSGNNNVGIGTINPGEILSVVASDTTGFEVLNSDASFATGFYVRGGNSIDNKGNNALLHLGQRSGNSIITTGAVGIGTTDPQASLHVWDGNINAIFELKDNTADNFVIKQSSNEYLNIGTLNGNEKIIIGNNTTKPKVGIGTINPRVALHVIGGNGSLASPPSIDVNTDFILENLDNTAISLICATTGTGMIRFGDSDAEIRGMIHYDHSNDRLKFQTAASDALFIDNYQNVGIGTDSPNIGGFSSGSKILTIEGNSSDKIGAIELANPEATSTNLLGSILFINKDGGSSATARASINSRRDGADDAANLILETEATGGSLSERMRITSSGKVGVGTTNPGAFPSAGGRFHVFNTSSSQEAIIAQIEDGSYTGSVLDTKCSTTGSTAYTHISSRSAGNTVFRVYGNGNIFSDSRIGIGTTNPQSKLHIFDSIASTINLYNTGTTATNIITNAVPTLADQDLHRLDTKWDGTTVSRINFICGSDTTNKDDGYITFDTKESGSTIAEKMRIEKNGWVGIGTTNPQSMLHVFDDNASSINLNNTGTTATNIFTNCVPTTADADLFRLRASWDGTSVSQIRFVSGADTANKDDGYIVFDTSTGTGTSERMRITKEGQVGIGTNNPGAFPSSGGKCHIFNDHASQESLIVHVSNGSYTGNVLDVKCSNTGTGFNLITARSGGNTVFKVRGDGQIFSDAGTTITTPADFAELTKVKGDKNDYSVGDVVMQSDEDLVVEKANNNPESFYGIVTDRAGFLGNLTGISKEEAMSLTIEEIIEKYNAVKVAMTGHVVVKVKGKIKKGQRLTLSDIVGVARAAESFEEKALGFAIARQDYNSDEIGTIEVRLL